VGAFAAYSVKSFIESQKVMAQTEAVLESTGGAANVTKDQVLKLADGLRDLTGVDNDAVQASENLLLTFTAVRNEAGKGNDVFNQTEKAIVDMATAMNNGAIPSMEQLSNTTIQVGKALNDPISGMTALRRVGVRFTEDQVAVITKLQESGDLMGAQKLILRELALEFGGAGKAAGQTMAGQMAILGSKFQDVAEDIGKALMPALQGLVEILEALVPLLGAVFKGIELAFSPETYSDIPVIGEAFHILGVGIQAVKDAVDTSDASVRQNIATMNTETEALSQTEKECREVAKSLGYMSGEAGGATLSITRFANMTEKELKEWSKGVKESFDKFTLGLEEGATQSNITRHEFVHASNVMEREARALAKAMRDISEEKWVNDKYIQFLSEQGPEWLIGFSKLTKEQQVVAQDAWETTTRKTDQAKDSLDRIAGALKTLYGTTKHNVIIQYDYVGFDPTKPGMSSTNTNKRP